VKQRVFDAGETLAKLLIASGLLKFEFGDGLWARSEYAPLTTCPGTRTALAGRRHLSETPTIVRNLFVADSARSCFLRPHLPVTPSCVRNTVPLCSAAL
jgi:hypothetical protein